MEEARGKKATGQSNTNLAARDIQVVTDVLVRRGALFEKFPSLFLSKFDFNRLGGGAFSNLTQWIIRECENLKKNKNKTLEKVIKRKTQETPPLCFHWYQMGRALRKASLSGSGSLERT